MMMTADATRCRHTKEVKGYQRLRSSFQMTLLSPLICCDHYGRCLSPTQPAVWTFFDELEENTHAVIDDGVVEVWFTRKLRDIRGCKTQFDDRIKPQSHCPCVHQSLILFLLSPDATDVVGASSSAWTTSTTRLFKVSSLPKYFGKYANLQVKKTIVVAFVACWEYSLNVQCCGV